MSDIAPPATGDWWDLVYTRGQVFAALRLQGGDIDTARIDAIIPAAARSIELELDLTVVLLGPPPDPLIQYELERRTINLYQANIPIAAIGAVPSWLPESGSSNVIAKFRERRGVA